MSIPGGPPSGELPSVPKPEAPAPKPPDAKPPEAQPLAETEKKLLSVSKKMVILIWY